MSLKNNVLSILIIPALLSTAFSRTQPLIIDYNCKNLTHNPQNWIDAAYSQAKNSNSLPDEAGALCIFDGQEGDTYICPNEYWEMNSGKQRECFY